MYQRGTLTVWSMGHLQYSCAICLRAHPKVIPAICVKDEVQDGPVKMLFAETA